MAKLAARRCRRRPAAGISTTMTEVGPIGAMLREMGFVGTDADPVSVRASFAPDGRPRSVKARYPGGWCCRLTLHKAGTYSMTQSISMTVGGRKA